MAASRIIAASRLALFGAAAMLATGAAAQDGADLATDAALHVLETHCARCHQDGALKDGLERPQGKFGYILDLDRVIKKRMVIPGNSSGSALLRQIENGSMPKDIAADCYLYPTPPEAYCGPTADEVAALRSWVDGLANPDLVIAAATLPQDGSEPGSETAETPDATEAPASVETAAQAAVAEPAPETAVAPEAASSPQAAETVSETADVEPGAADGAGAERSTSPEPAARVQTVAAESAEAVFLTDQDMLKAMSLDIATVPEQRRASQRYITLVHLRNAGDDEEALDVYRMATVKLLNSLSRKPDPVKPIFVDADRVIMRFDMQDLGWSEALWDKIAAANPYLLDYDDALYDALVDNTDSTMPFVRADWFAFVATQPPLYYDLLGLPDNKADFEKALGVDSMRNINALDIARAGFRKSGVSTNNRMIERHQMATGPYWESYDFGGNAGRQDFFTFPLGPQGAFNGMSDEHGFHADGGEIIFALPNGFHAYYLTTGVGKRLDRGPTEIVRDDSRRDAAVTNGISCFGCHDQGIKHNPYRAAEELDEIRDVVLANITIPKEVRETVAEIFPPHERFYELLQADASAYEASLKRAGVDMRVKYDGMEMINALFARFEEDVTARMAAAEFGLTEEEFFTRLGMAGGSAYTLKIRLSQDRIPRDQFVKEYGELAAKITDYEPVTFEAAVEASKDTVTVSEARPAQASKTFDLSLVPTTEKYFVGDELTFTVKSAEPCFLTLVNVDDTDAVQIVFPNKFNDENEIEANREYTIPSDEIGGFKFVFAKPGKEKVIAICNASRATPRGIVHDFDKEAYTTFRSINDFTKSRLISVEKDGKSIKAGDAAAEPQAQALIEATVDPQVDIVAQKAVVLDVADK